MSPETNINTAEATRVYNLVTELEDMKRRKKTFVKAYNAEIKALQDEIKDILDPDNAVEELP
jgi:hypothetical protein